MTTHKLILASAVILFICSTFGLAASLSLSLGSYDSEMYKHDTINLPVVVTATNITGNADVVLSPKSGLSCDTCTISYTFTGGTNEQGTVTFTLTGTQAGTYNPPFVSISGSSGAVTATSLTAGNQVTVVERPTWTKSLGASSNTIATDTLVTLTLTITPSGTFEGVEAVLTLPADWDLVSGTATRSIGTITGETSYQWIVRSGTSSGTKTPSVAISAASPSESGSENTETVSITVTSSGTAPEGTPGGTTGSGGGGGAPADTYWTATYTVDAAQFSAGYTRQLGLKQRVKLMIGGEAHYVGVVGLTQTQATINVSSKPQQAVLNVGEAKSFDVTDDKIYDLSATLDSIANSTATLTVRQLSQPVATDAGDAAGGTIEDQQQQQSCVPSWQCGDWSECVGGNKARVCTDQNSCGTQEGKPAEEENCTKGFPFMFAIIIVLAIGIIAAEVISIIRKRKPVN